MNEPTRMVHSPESELERALLDAGRSYTASGSTRAKTLLALGLTAVTTSAAPSAAAAAGSSLSKATLTKVAATVLVMGAVAVPVWRYLDHTPSGTPVTHPVASAAAVSPTSPAVTEQTPVEAVPAETPAVAPPRVEVAEAQPAANARSVSTARTDPKASAAPPLTAELAALDSARTSLSHSDPAGALTALDSYARNFPRGRLKMEAEVLRIGALAKSGQTEVARKRAEAFLRLHPDSVLASRVRSYAGL
ncbi:MAG TPA: hypothetical protein VER11_07890 [Polyangiaceae bacterium]|nr:hypothetical protein [Polyangiaceae bacterium]